MENDVEAQFASVEEATGLIRLAQTHDLPQYLSPAFYYLATKSNPGTVFSIKTLSPTDQARIYAGRVKMTSAIIGIVARRPENGMRKGPCTSGSQPCYGCMELMWPGLPEGEILSKSSSGDITTGAAVKFDPDIDVQSELSRASLQRGRKCIEEWENFLVYD
ncbi:hypothetical protein FRC03_011017 [Tulasnella sp. 419]|nr:hypothetical protein FRC03_011017 [Tulasnella sp. 419]